MAPVSAAERAALDGFFKGKRGTRVLIRTSADALTTYFADKGTTLAELNTSRPATRAGHLARGARTAVAIPETSGGTMVGRASRVAAVGLETSSQLPPGWCTWYPMAIILLDGAVTFSTPSLALERGGGST